MNNQVEFYRDPKVRERIAQYCGGFADDSQSFTAEYLVGYGESLQWEKTYPEGFVSLPKKGFPWILEKGLDIFRSNWDRESTLGILDIEYFNIDFPGEPYAHPRKTFEKLEPLYQAILRVFSRFGISPLVIMTGQGYHFSTRASRRTKTELKLEELGKIPPSLKGKYASSGPRRPRYVSYRHGKAFEGMGRLMEYLTHLILQEAAASLSLPVVTTDVAIGRVSPLGREAMSIDLSMYGDPLYMRDIRCPFSSYQKHKVERHKAGEDLALHFPIQVALPRGDLGLEDLFKMRFNFRAAADYAAQVETEIPECSPGFEKLIEAYKASSLCHFHLTFDQEEHDPLEIWHRTYDAFDCNLLPPCVNHCLKFPNDHLLKPTNIQHLTRVLMKLGWHPKHIAGLIRSKFERDYGWGPTWMRYDASSRANFYVRLFAGLLTTGQDGEKDLNCLSYQEKGYCWQPFCGFNLADYNLYKK